MFSSHFNNKKYVSIILYLQLIETKILFGWAYQLHSTSTTNWSITVCIFWASLYHYQWPIPAWSCKAFTLLENTVYVNIFAVKETVKAAAAVTPPCQMAFILSGRDGLCLLTGQATAFFSLLLRSCFSQVQIPRKHISNKWTPLPMFLAQAGLTNKVGFLQ